MEGMIKEIDVSNWESSTFEPISFTMSCNQTLKIVTFDDQRQIIKIQTDNPINVGRYQIKLKG